MGWCSQVTLSSAPVPAARGNQDFLREGGRRGTLLGRGQTTASNLNHCWVQLTRLAGQRKRRRAITSNNYYLYFPSFIAAPY